MTDASGKLESKESGAVERGTQYPNDSLDEAVKMLERVRDAIGFSPAQREMIANAIGYKTMSGHAARRLGSLSHYNLIERSGKGAARISALGKSILMPTREDERRAALVAAVKSPNLYSALIAKYAGHALPTLLPNLLVREHGVNASVADVAASTFRDSVEFVGLLRNGVLYAELEVADSGSAPGGAGAGEGSGESGTPGVSGGGSPKVKDPARHDDEKTFTIPLDSAGRMATIQLPLPITKRDLKKIGAWLSYMSAVVEDEETPDISGN